MRKILTSIFNRYLPGYCLLCERVLGSDQGNSPDHLCCHCRLTLPLNLHACRHCALPVPGSDGFTQPICGSCITRPLAHRTFAPLIHQGAGAYLLHRLKFSRGEAEGHTLAQFMLAQIAPHVAKTPPDFLLPVPLNYWALVKRGFNQSSLLAGAIGAKLRIPVEDKLIARRRGPAQRTLSRIQRQQLARHRFIWRGRSQLDLRDKYVAVIDDVLTTGATARQIVHLLQQRGAGRVDVWCATRAEAGAG
jgi:ComF family protein